MRRSVRRAIAAQDSAHKVDNTLQVRLLAPKTGWRWPRLREIWSYRELLYFLAWRDVKVRYKQTLIGASWAILQPLMTMIVFTVIFGGLLRVPSDDVPYPVFAYAALLPWIFFASAVTRASNSLVADADLISKVYFPRVIAPLASVAAPAVDFVLALLILVPMLAVYGIPPSPALLAVPLILLLVYLAALGVGLWLAALNVKYRDIGFIVPFLTQFWFFLTPVAYPSSIIPQDWRAVYGLNPMAGLIEGFRWAILGTELETWATMSVSVVVVALVLVSGALYFQRVEAEFADIV